MRYALIYNEQVENIIELSPKNAADFPGAVPIPADVPVSIGDTYRDGSFHLRGGTDPHEIIDILTGEVE